MFCCSPALVAVVVSCLFSVLVRVSCKQMAFTGRFRVSTVCVFSLCFFSLLLLSSSLTHSFCFCCCCSVLFVHNTIVRASLLLVQPLGVIFEFEGIERCAISHSILSAPDLEQWFSGKNSAATQMGDAVQRTTKKMCFYNTKSNRASERQNAFSVIIFWRQRLTVAVEQWQCLCCLWVVQWH